MRYTSGPVARLLSRGQIVIPAEIRSARGWEPGLFFAFDETPEGLLLRPMPRLPATRPRDVRGCTGYRGPRLSLADMSTAIARGARRRR